MHRYGDERRDVIWSHSFAVATFIFETTFDCISTYHTTFRPCVKRQDGRAPVRPTARLDRELHWLSDRKQSGTAGWNAPRVAGTADVPRSGTSGPKESPCHRSIAAVIAKRRSPSRTRQRWSFPPRPSPRPAPTLPRRLPPSASNLAHGRGPQGDQDRVDAAILRELYARLAA